MPGSNNSLQHPMPTSRTAKLNERSRPLKVAPSPCWKLLVSLSIFGAKLYSPPLICGTEQNLQPYHQEKHLTRWSMESSQTSHISAFLAHSAGHGFPLSSKPNLDQSHVMRFFSANQRASKVIIYETLAVAPSSLHAMLSLMRTCRPVRMKMTRMIPPPHLHLRQLQSKRWQSWCLEHHPHCPQFPSQPLPLKSSPIDLVMLSK